MLFKVTIFLLILLLVAVLGVRGYGNAVRRFEARAEGADVGAGDAPTPAPSPQSPDQS